MPHRRLLLCSWKSFSLSGTGWSSSATALPSHTSARVSYFCHGFLNLFGLLELFLFQLDLENRYFRGYVQFSKGLRVLVYIWSLKHASKFPFKLIAIPRNVYEVDWNKQRTFERKCKDSPLKRWKIPSNPGWLRSLEIVLAFVVWLLNLDEFKTICPFGLRLSRVFWLLSRLILVRETYVNPFGLGCEIPYVALTLATFQRNIWLVVGQQFCILSPSVLFPFLL